MTDTQLTASARLLALAAYLGLAPFLLRHAVAGSSASSDAAPTRGQYLAQHIRQAQTLFAVLAGLILLYGVVILCMSAMLVFRRDFYEDTMIPFYLADGLKKLFLSWGVFWGFSVLLALLGSTRPVLLISRLAQQPRVLDFGRRATYGGYALLLMLGLLAAHASWTVRPLPGTAPKAVMLYDDMDLFPRWVFALGFYRIARAANAQWGPGQADVRPFTRRNLGEVQQHASFLFLATHGTEEGLQLEHGKLTPEAVMAMPSATMALDFVYITGCDSGAQQAAWEAAFAPAEVITFDRLSAIVEHIWWLWMRGPEVIRSLPENPANAGAV